MRGQLLEFWQNVYEILFPNFTRHQQITHTNSIVNYSFSKQFT